MRKDTCLCADGHGRQALRCPATHTLGLPCEPTHWPVMNSTRQGTEARLPHELTKHGHPVLPLVCLAFSAHACGSCTLPDWIQPRQRGRSTSQTSIRREGRDWISPQSRQPRGKCVLRPAFREDPGPTDCGVGRDGDQKSQLALCPRS